MNYLLCHTLSLLTKFCDANCRLRIPVFIAGFELPSSYKLRACAIPGLFARLATTSRAGALDDSKDLVFAHNQKFFTVDLDFRAAVLAE